MRCFCVCCFSIVYQVINFFLFFGVFALFIAELEDSEDGSTIDWGTVQTIDLIARYMVYGAGGVAVLLFMFWGCHGTLYWKGSDVPNYGAVFRYVHSVVDFWSDVLFVYCMYLYGKDLLFYGSALFTVLPLLCSILLAIYWIYRWRTMIASVPQRIADYLGKYSMALILFMILGNFTSAVELVQSKLFHHTMFNFPLKIDENEQLRVWRFVNITLLEVSMLYMFFDFFSFFFFFF